MTPTLSNAKDITAYIICGKYGSATVTIAKDITAYNICGKYGSATVTRDKKDPSTILVICKDGRVGLTIKNICVGKKVKVTPDPFDKLHLTISCID